MKEEYDDIYQMYKDEPWRRDSTESKIRDSEIKTRARLDEEDDEKYWASKGYLCCVVCGMPYKKEIQSVCGHIERLSAAKEKLLNKLKEKVNDS